MGVAYRAILPMTKMEAIMIKFNRYYVTDGTIKVRVFYSLDNHVSGRKVVTLYGKNYDDGLRKIIPDASTNDSEYHTDYVASDVARLFEGHPLYTAARQCAEAIAIKRTRDFA